MVSTEGRGLPKVLVAAEVVTRAKERDGGRPVASHAVQISGGEDNRRWDDWVHCHVREKAMGALGKKWLMGRPRK
jgi:hypothetical protein